MRTLTDADSNHKIVKYLLELGYHEIQLIYEPYFSPDWGWTLVGVTYPPELLKMGAEPLFGFLGYHTKEVLKNITIHRLKQIGYAGTKS